MVNRHANSNTPDHCNRNWGPIKLKNIELDKTLYKFTKRLMPIKRSYICKLQQQKKCLFRTWANTNNQQEQKPILYIKRLLWKKLFNRVCQMCMSKHVLRVSAWRVGCPWAWWLPSWHGWHTGLCPRTDPPSRPQQPPAAPAPHDFGTLNLSAILRDHISN